jgi:predicted ester cyclase
MTDADREIGTRWFEEVWNKGRREAIAEMLAPGAPIHECGETTYGPEGFYPYFDRLQSAFSNVHITVLDTIAQDDRLCIRWACTMRHTGPGLGMPATGRTLATTGISIVRVAGGQAIECWQNWDMLGVMQQIEQANRAPTYIAAPRAESA